MYNNARVLEDTDTLGTGNYMKKFNLRILGLSSFNIHK